jgi:hypothetical protein
MSTLERKILGRLSIELRELRGPASPREIVAVLASSFGQYYEVEVQDEDEGDLTWVPEQISFVAMTVQVRNEVCRKPGLFSLSFSADSCRVK